MLKTSLLDIFSGYGIDVEWWAWRSVETDVESRVTRFDVREVELSSFFASAIVEGELERTV
jgi:hypothetical protein